MSGVYSGVYEDFGVRSGPMSMFRRTLREVLGPLEVSEIARATGLTLVTARRLQNGDQGLSTPPREVIDDLMTLLPPLEAEKLSTSFERTERRGRRSQVLSSPPTTRETGLRVQGDVNLSSISPEVLRTLSGANIIGDLNVGDAVGAVEDTPPSAVAPPLDAHPDVLPDPFAAGTREEFMAVLRDLWRYADRPSTRDLSRRSAPRSRPPAFSHALAAGLVSENPDKWPTIRLHYVQGFVRACGGDTEIITRWTAAWRHVFEGFALPAPAESHALPPGVTAIRRDASTG